MKTQFSNYKTIKLFTLSIFALAFFASCSDDDTPTVVNEEEVITTLTLRLTPVGGGTTLEFKSQDTDGDGPNTPDIIDGLGLLASTEYTGTIEFLNELESPAEDITEEVLEEGDEHQVFYSFTGTSGSTVTYNDMDENGNPIGLDISLNSGTAATNNSITIILRHEPTKPNDGTASAAGGETDVEATFTFNVN